MEPIKEKRKKKSKKEKHSKKIKYSDVTDDKETDISKQGEEIYICASKTNEDLQSHEVNSEKNLQESICNDIREKTRKEKRKDKVDTGVHSGVSSNKISRSSDYESESKEIKTVTESKHIKNETKLKNNKSSNGDNTAVVNEEEEDPEKAAIRKKKREKRHQKKLEKLKLKQEKEARAGTAKASAIAYLNQWDSERDKWKFMKVRQVWCLQNMYDSELLDEGTFEILLRYLKPLKGHSKDTTVASAEKIIKEAEVEEQDNDEIAGKADRARQIIQLLSD